MATSECRAWYEGDPIPEKYYDHEWCKERRDDRLQFEMPCLEGAGVGHSWRTIMHKRDAYRATFQGFDIDVCVSMTDEELESLLHDPGIVCNRSRVQSVIRNHQPLRLMVTPAARHCG